MDELIQALQIFRMYGNPAYPTYCEHDKLIITGYNDYNIFSKDDIEKLDDLGFFWDEEVDGFISFKFGSS